MASNPSHVCVCSQMHNHRIVLESECPHSTDFCIALSLSLSFYFIYDPSNNVHLLFTIPVLFTRKIIALVLQTLLSFSLSLSFSIKFSPLQTLPPPVPVFLPVIISCICIYRDRSREKICTRDDR